MQSSFFTNAAIVGVLLAAAYAASAVGTPQRNSVAPPTTAATGRFELHGEGTQRILLDTQTGDTWVMRSSTAFVDARLQAWLPLTLVRDEPQYDAWLEKATTRYNTYVEGLNKQILDSLRAKEEQLGPNHNQVVEMREMIKSGVYTPLSKAEMRKAIESQ